MTALPGAASACTHGHFSAAEKSVIYTITVSGDVSVVSCPAEEALHQIR
jgi:hypothetical protein